MKNSMFNIIQSIDDKFLVYNTFSTSLIKLSHELYQEIFVNNNYSLKEVPTLYDMGFLVDKDYNEVAAMEKIRKEVINSSSTKIANIIIAPTLNCNAHCYYCFENGHRKGKMSYETADAVVSFLLKHWNGDKLTITWFGGEPLMGSDIIDYISKKLLDHGVNYSCKITTNGSLFTKEIAKKSIDLWHVERVQITLDAVGDEYNRIKNYDKEYPDAFSLVLNNIDTGIKLGINFKIRINFNPKEQNKAINIMNFLLDRYHNSPLMKIYFAPIDAEDDIVKNIANDFDEYTEHPYISLIKFGRKNNLYKGFPDMEDYQTTIPDRDSNGLLKKLKIYPCPINCYATCPNVFTIGPKGELYKCHRTLGRKEYSTGTVLTGIQKNDAYNFFCNTDLTYEECTTCPILPICQGGCKTNSIFYSGFEGCAPSKAIIKDLILMYYNDLQKLS